MNTYIDVALILWNPDVIQMASFVLEQRCLKAKGLEPYYRIQNIEHWIACCDPTVVVFDLRPPYYMSVRVARRLLERFPDRSFVFTIADPQLAINIAPWLLCHPILRKPYCPERMGRIVEELVSRALIVRQ